MDRDQTKQILKIVQQAYPRFEVVNNSFGVDVWHKSLEDLEYDKAEKATYNCIRKNEFPPSIAEIRKAYEDITIVERKEYGDINRFYEQARAYYPGAGEIGYGKKEFFDKAKTPEQAERLYNSIIRYVNSCTDRTMDFKECIRSLSAL